MEKPPTPADFAARLREIVETHGADYGGAHIEMDDLLCETLRALGYEAGIDYYEEQQRWFS